MEPGGSDRFQELTWTIALANAGPPTKGMNLKHSGIASACRFEGEHMVCLLVNDDFNNDLNY